MSHVHALHATSATFFHARVIAADGERFAVAYDAGRSWVDVAAGCLIFPQVGDTVLVSFADGGYVLTVLRRGDAAAREMRFVGDLKFTVANGRLDLSGEHGVALDAHAGLTVRADAVAMRLGRAHLHCDELDVVGGRVHAAWGESALVTERQFVAASHAETNLGESVRHVAGHDEQVAGSMRQTVAADWTVQAHDASVIAARRVTVDADEQVQLG